MKTISAEEAKMKYKSLWSCFGVWLRNLQAWKSVRANRDLQRAMLKDPDFAHVWQCNIAMPIFDGSNGKLTLREANEIADQLMSHLFNVNAKSKYYRAKRTKKNY